MRPMKTKEEYFDFEKENQRHFNEYYKSQGWPYKRIYGKENKDYDCVVLIDWAWIKIEEKYRSKEYPDLLAETIQDTKTNSPGWLYYTKADWLLYGVSDKIYKIDMSMLKSFIENHGDKFNKKISKKGWGITENIAIPWYTIIHNGIGQRIK